MSAWAERSIAAFAECLFVRDPQRPDPVYAERIRVVAREVDDLLQKGGPRARRMFHTMIGSTASMIVIRNAVWRFIGPSEVGPV